ncbi:MAG: class I SAM-dependent methyltransferase, partial [Caldilineaceae bacterium]|nr:class I SAM-dependent methyltransferase [Caldilineaceae bacterium]
MIDQFHPQQIVATGYDHISASYTAWARSVRIAERQHYMQVIWDHVATGGDVLDLGCPTGALTSGQLTERFNLTGVDISPRQIELARQQLPNATWICADMTKVTFAPSSFDAVVAFYSIIHVPQAEQPM